MASAHGASADDNAAALADRLARGVCRMLVELGYGPLTEFRVNGTRRVDVIGLDGTGRIAIVEIKTTANDFRADRKWREYLPYCDSFYFAVPEDFPRDILPADRGLIVAGPFDAAVVRESPPAALNATRRRHLVLRVALAASRRLHRATDPRL